MLTKQNGFLITNNYKSPQKNYKGTRLSTYTSDKGVSTAQLKPRLTAAANMYTSDFPDIKFRVAALKRYWRKQSSSGIQIIIRIGFKS